MRGSTLFVLSLLLVLLAESTSGYRYIYHREHGSLDLPSRHGKGYPHRRHDSRYDTHLVRREDTEGVDVDRTKAQQLAKQRNKKRIRYN
ncbi:hypothetical protein TcWFU_006836 [Taenia crassiceps]|uniref:Secreted protein n=1 Tax=Taenia crassiceps TaxID=6207 RepID=A0ABR4Q9G2_9CEST